MLNFSAMGQQGKKCLFGWFCKDGMGNKLMLAKRETLVVEQKVFYLREGKTAIKCM